MAHSVKYFFKTWLTCTDIPPESSIDLKIAPCSRKVSSDYGDVTHDTFIIDQGQLAAA